jgi:transcription elongation factor Elf1
MNCPMCKKGTLTKVLVQPFNQLGYYQCSYCNAANSMREFKEMYENQAREIFEKYYFNHEYGDEDLAL